MGNKGEIVIGCSCEAAAKRNSRVGGQLSPSPQRFLGNSCNGQPSQPMETTALSIKATIARTAAAHDSDIRTDCVGRRDGAIAGNEVEASPSNLASPARRIVQLH